MVVRTGSGACGNQIGALLRLAMFQSDSGGQHLRRCEFRTDFWMQSGAGQ